MDRVNIDKGCIISPFVTIGSNTNIGKSVLINLYSYIEHDCQVGNFVTVSPGVKCNGNVIIEDNVFIGSGTIILNGTKDKKIVIGKNSVIGAGSLILRSIPPNSKVAGSPAKNL